MKVLLITHNFPPDLGAASFRFESLVRELTKNNDEVDVLTSMPNRIHKFDLSKDELKINGFKINRFKSSKLGTSKFKVALNYFEFFLKSLKDGIKLAKKNDVIIASSPQLLIGVVGALISLITKKKFILEVRDLWPDIIVEMNVMKRWNPIYLFLKVLESFMYWKSDAIIYNSPAFYEYLKKKNPNKKLKLITNGIDKEIIDIFKEEKINKKVEKIKLIYAGNLGIAQNLNTLLDIAEKFTKELEIILVGKGSDEKKISERIEKEKLINVKLIKSMPRKELYNLYKEADVLYLQLQNIEMFEKTIPSKIFEYIATKKRVIYGIKGVGKGILKELNCEYYYEPENSKELEKVINKVILDIKNNIDVKNNVELLEKKYSREELSKKYRKFIEEVVNENK
uniref:Glycosyltransferase WbuB n=1 Tax=Hirondellea gigas TaxID=1518452 RepID=A0A6A7G8F3_9CRUS